MCCRTWSGCHTSGSKRPPLHSLSCLAWRCCYVITGKGVVQSFRRHQRLFLIALAAFLAQTFFALAHVHTSAKSSSHEILNRSACLSATREYCTAPSPARDGADCPLCAALHLASALIAPVSPAATLPILFAPDRAIVVIAFTHITPRASRFRARAPPAVPA